MSEIKLIPDNVYDLMRQTLRSMEEASINPEYIWMGPEKLYYELIKEYPASPRCVNMPDEPLQENKDEWFNEYIQPANIENPDNT